MRNDVSKIKTIIFLAKKLPYFSLDDLGTIETNKSYLRILLSRYEKSGKIIRLKKGLYVAKEYIDNIQKRDKSFCYSEFVSNLLYSPSYLSLNYVLYQHNLLTEIPNHFTSVSKNKTASFSNKFGAFFYHKIQDKLFYGFKLIKQGDFTILKATKAKALFDFLYLQKNSLVNKKAFEELRLNLSALSKKDITELKKYFKKEGSKKMKDILSYFIK